ncbi:MAG: hypothetical protein WCG67_01720 [Ferruginibacter sp.]
MKRLDLVQLTLIIVGLFCAFFVIDLIPNFIYYLFTWVTEGLRGGYLMELFIENIMHISLYLIISIYAIKNSKRFAEMICSKGDLNAAINLNINAAELLYVIFTGLGVFGIIKNLPTLITDAYNYIKGNYPFESESLKYQIGVIDIAKIAITLFLFIVLMYYAKVFADFFAAKINNTEPEDEIANNPQ